MDLPDKLTVASGFDPRRAAIWAAATGLVLMLLGWVVWSPGEPSDGGEAIGGLPMAAAVEETVEETTDVPQLEVSGRLPKNLAERADNAVTILDELLAAPDDGIPEALLEDTRCVAVIPRVIKVGFGFGGRHGKGLVSCRTGGSWSRPSFISLTGGSFGLQIGAQATDFVLLFQADRSAEQLTENKVTLGGDLSVSAGPIGRTAEAGTDIKLQTEIYSYSRSKGLFAGVSLEGSTLRADRDANEEAYGNGVGPDELLFSREGAVPTELAALVRRLEATGH